METGEVDIYAQHINADGTLGGLPASNVRVTLYKEIGSLGQSFPNPASDEIFIPVTLDTNDKISLKLINSVGQEVSVIIEGRPGPGAHTF